MKRRAVIDRRVVLSNLLLVSDFRIFKSTEIETE